jgi:hypothetical protein
MSSHDPRRVRLDENGKKQYTPTYNSWRSMKKRCLWPGAVDWEFYGGRGVTVCDAWLTFEGFYADMGERPEGMTLDRKDPHGNYEPSNCRWATASDQARNKRRTVGTEV